MKYLSAAVVASLSLSLIALPVNSQEIDYSQLLRFDFYQCGYIYIDDNPSPQWLRAVGEMDCDDDPAESNRTIPPRQRAFGGSSSSSDGGGNCDRPGDIAADGSICGGRAASERPGGR